MSKAGELYENPVTGKRVVVRLGTEESAGEDLVVDLYVAPGGAVAGEHGHSGSVELEPRPGYVQAFGHPRP